MESHVRWILNALGWKIELCWVQNTCHWQVREIKQHLCHIFAIQE